MSDDARTIAVLDAALQEALDVLEQVVRQWLVVGDDDYYVARTETDILIADQLALRRPDRWERAHRGLRRRPASAEAFPPFEHRGPGGADVV